MQSGSLGLGIGMPASYQRFSLLQQPTRLGRRKLLSSVKRVRQTDGAHTGADEPTPTEKSHHQLTSKTGKFRWGTFVEQGSKSSARLKPPPSKLHLSAWNTTQSAPYVKDRNGASIYEISNGRDGVTDRLIRRSHPERRLDTITNERGGPLLPVDTQEGSSEIVETRLLNRDLQKLSYQPAHKAIRRNTKQQTSQSQPPNKSLLSLAMQNAQRQTPPLQPWQVQKRALFEKFGSSGWCPRKRLAPDVLESVRALNSQSPEKYTTPVLAEQFKVSPEAIRRILKSKWRPDEEEQAKRKLRWEKRGKSIWSQMVEIGIKPPKKWRAMGVKKG